jgi:hypothetical protein
LWLIGLLVFEGTKTNLYQFPHRRAQGGHLAFALVGQAFILGLDVWIVGGRHDRPFTLLPDSCCTGTNPKYAEHWLALSNGRLPMTVNIRVAMTLPTA